MLLNYNIRKINVIITSTISKTCLCGSSHLFCALVTCIGLFLLKVQSGQLSTKTRHFLSFNLQIFSSCTLENTVSKFRPSYIHISFLHPMYSESSKRTCL